MPYQSPYRGPTPQEQRTRELIGRGAMLLLGSVLLFVGWRVLSHTYAAQAAAATRPAAAVYRPVRGDGMGYLWIVGSALVLVGGITAAFSLVPTNAMEKLLSPLNSAPVTGDRTPGLDDNYRDWNSPYYRPRSVGGGLLWRLLRRRR